MPTLQQIRTEIDTDPKSLGYAAMLTATNAPEQIAARMNQPGASTPPETLTKSWTPTEEITAVLVDAEVTGLSVAKRELLAIICSTPRVKTGSATLRATMGSIFGAGATRTALVALTTRNASRAEALWGEFVQVRDDEVANALAI